MTTKKITKKKTNKTLKDNVERIQIRLYSPEGFEAKSQWDAWYESVGVNIHGKNKNARLEELIIKGMQQDYLENSSATSVIEEALNKVISKQSKLIVKSITNRVESIAMNQLKYSIIFEKMLYFITNTLNEMGITDASVFLEPHAQLLKAMPWIDQLKDRVDSEMANKTKKDYFIDFNTISTESVVESSKMEAEIKADIKTLTNFIKGIK